MTATAPDTIDLVPCATESSVTCFWDATVQGGDVSYFTYDNYTVALLVPAGSHIAGVTVDADGLDWENVTPGYAVEYVKAAPAATTQTPTNSVSTPATTPEADAAPLSHSFDPSLLLAVAGVAVAVALVGIVAAWTASRKNGENR